MVMFFNIDTRSPIVSKFLSFSLSKDSKSLMLLPILLILLVWRLPTLVYPPRAWPLGDGILTVYLYLLLFVLIFMRQNARVKNSSHKKADTSEK